MALQTLSIESSSPCSPIVLYFFNLINQVDVILIYQITLGGPTGPKTTPLEPGSMMPMLFLELLNRPRGPPLQLHFRRMLLRRLYDFIPQTKGGTTGVGFLLGFYRITLVRQVFPSPSPSPT